MALFFYFWLVSGNPLPDPGHSCAVMDSGAGSNWKSSVCSKKLGYICQKGGSLPPPTEGTEEKQEILCCCGCANLFSLKCITALLSVEAGHCSSPWIPYNGQCFHLHREKKTWSDAQTECRKEGGDLASVHNIEDHSFVVSQLGYGT